MERRREFVSPEDIAALGAARRAKKLTYSRARAKQKRGEKLTYTERQVLEEAADFRRRKEDASARKDMQYALRGTHTDPQFVRTKYGWRVTIPDGYLDRQWSTHDELEVLTVTGKMIWVTLLRFVTQGGDANRLQWWTFVEGRQSKVVKHVAPKYAPPVVRVENKRETVYLEEEDEERVSTGAGAAYLNAARRKKTAKRKTKKEGRS